MKWALLFTISILTPQIFAATLNCSLNENKTAVAVFAVPVSIPGQDATFNFTQHLDGQEFSSDVIWDKDFITMRIRHNASAIENENTGRWSWEYPFEAFFQSKLGAASLNCRLSFEDGYNYRWQMFRDLLWIRANTLRASLDFFLKAAQFPESNPKELAEKTNAICLMIGKTAEYSTIQDFYQQLVSLDSTAFSAKLFPDAFYMYRKLRNQVDSMKEYCIAGDDNPEYQNAATLIKKAQDAKNYLDFTLKYLDHRFPNNGTFGN